MTADLLDRPIAFHRCLVTITGSITAALLLSQGIYWGRRSKERDGWFYKTQEEWTEETGMSRAEQETARRKLCALGVWEEKHQRLIHRKWYRVNMTELSRMLLSSIRESDEPSLPNDSNSHPSYTAETTTKNTGEALDLFAEPEGRKTKKGASPTVIFTSPELQQAWDNYTAMRKERGKTLTPRSIKMLVDKIATWEDADAIASLNQSAEAGWLGVFPVKKAGQFLRAENPSPKPIPSAAQQRRSRNT